MTVTATLQIETTRLRSRVYLTRRVIIRLRFQVRYLLDVWSWKKRLDATWNAVGNARHGALARTAESTMQISSRANAERSSSLKAGEGWGSDLLQQGCGVSYFTPCVVLTLREAFRTGYVRVTRSDGGFGESMMWATHFVRSSRRGCEGKREHVCPSGPTPSRQRSKRGSPSPDPKVLLSLASYAAAAEGQEMRGKASGRPVWAIGASCAHGSSINHGDDPRPAVSH